MKRIFVKTKSAAKAYCFFLNGCKLKCRSAVLLLILLQISAPVFGGNSSLPAEEIIDTITAKDLKMHLDFLASDELGGRFTFNPSSYIAARYLASRLESYGYRGAGRGGSFFQQVPFAALDLDNKNYRVSLKSENREIKLNYAKDFMFFNTGDRTTLKLSGNNLRAKFDGSLVFVGYGISSPRNNHDDYAGLDVKGKIIVRVSNRPESLKKAKLEADEQTDRAAAKHGAAASIVISTGLQKIWDGFSDTLLNETERRLRPNAEELGRSRQEENDPAIPQILAGPSLVKTLTEMSGETDNYLSGADGHSLQPRDLNGRIEFDMGFTLSEAPAAYNVVGILEGTDAKLKNEYVVLTAHYDTLGSEKKQDKNSIHNGADDNASGTSAVLEIAEAFAEGKRPKRSIMVVFYTAEELGLFGSQFSTDYEPLVPLKNMIANFNLDMVGRSAGKGDSYKRPPFGDKTADENSVFIITNEDEFGELKKLHEETNIKTVNLNSDYTYSNLKARSLMYYRTDSYNYAKQGIPFITYFTGLHQDYHTPGDDIEKIDFQKMERIAKLTFATSWQVADSNLFFLKKI